MVHLPTESWLVMHERQTEPIPGVKADPKREKCVCVWGGDISEHVLRGSHVAKYITYVIVMQHLFSHQRFQGSVALATRKSRKRDTGRLRKLSQITQSRKDRPTQDSSQVFAAPKSTLTQ